MKPIYRTRDFNRFYSERIGKNEELRQLFEEAVSSFVYDRDSVDDHALEGKMGNFRSFSVTRDIRVVYSETEDYIVFHNVGKHAEVYRGRIYPWYLP